MLNTVKAPPRTDADGALPLVVQPSLIWKITLAVWSSLMIDDTLLAEFVSQLFGLYVNDEIHYPRRLEVTSVIEPPLAR